MILKNNIKPKRLSILLLFLIPTLLISSCKEDDDSDDLPKSSSTSLSAKQKMTNKNFKYVEYNYSIDGVTFSTLNDFQDCQKDDITTFLDDGTYTYDDNTNRCSTSSPKVITANWSLIDDDTKLVLEGESPQTILINDGTTLKLNFVQMVDIDSDGTLEENSFTTTYRAE